ncbi:MAG: energy transducer TonB [Cyclobacteriaceae bacterium]
MKRNIQLVILLSAIALWQGCASKGEGSADESKAITQAQAAQMKKDEVAAKRALLVKASVLKAEERARAAAERAKLTPTYKDALGNTIYIKAEVDPSYNGGDEAMSKYLRDNLKYPDAARDKGLQGTVFVDFVIDSKGRVREVVASDVVGEDVDISLKEEAVRVVASMPAWNAGLQQAKAVDVSFSIPITFDLVN